MLFLFSSPNMGYTVYQCTPHNAILSGKKRATIQHTGSALVQEISKRLHFSQGSARPAEGCSRYPMCPNWGSWTPTLFLTGRDVAGPCITEPCQGKWKSCRWITIMIMVDDDNDDDDDDDDFDLPQLLALSLVFHVMVFYVQTMQQTFQPLRATSSLHSVFMFWGHGSHQSGSEPR